VPAEDLDQIRAAAAKRGTSVQSYLREAVHAQAIRLRRQAALAATVRRLRGRPEVLDNVRHAVLEDIARAHEARAEQLGPCQRMIIHASVITVVVADPRPRGDAARDALAALPAVEPLLAPGHFAFEVMSASAQPQTDLVIHCSPRTSLLRSRMRRPSRSLSRQPRGRTCAPCDSYRPWRADELACSAAVFIACRVCAMPSSIIVSR